MSDVNNKFGKFQDLNNDVNNVPVSQEGLVSKRMSTMHCKDDVNNDDVSIDSVNTNVKARKRRKL